MVMGIWLIIFGAVIGICALGFGINLVKQDKKISGYLLSLVGVCALCYAGYVLAIILNALLSM